VGVKMNSSNHISAFVEKRLIKKEQEERARLMLTQDHFDQSDKKIHKESELSASEAVKKGR